MNNRKAAAGEKFFKRIYFNFLNPVNPRHKLTFFVPHYLYMRAIPFCEQIEKESSGFNIDDLSEVLYIDFLEFVKKTNDIHGVYKRLVARDLAPVDIYSYNTDDAYKGVIFEEMRGYEQIDVHLDHKDALRGEYLLRDMLDIYAEHKFTLENILEIVFCDFIDDYRRGAIKNPVNKILQYLE